MLLCIRIQQMGFNFLKTDLRVLTFTSDRIQPNVI